MFGLGSAEVNAHLNLWLYPRHKQAGKGKNTWLYLELIKPDKICMAITASMNTLPNSVVLGYSQHPISSCLLAQLSGLLLHLELGQMS